MICPVCGSDKNRVLETRSACGGKVDRRRHECVCGIRWTSRATVEAGSVVSVAGAKTDATGSVMFERRDATRSVSLVSPGIAGDTRHTLPVASGSQAPPPTGSVTPLPVALGGVGGGLSADRSGKIGSESKPDPDPNPNAQRISEPRAPARSALLPYPTRPRVFVAAKTLEFLAVYDRYPRGHKKEQASQVWQEVAETFPGGEVGLRDVILARFDAGMLTRPPYSGPVDKRPCLDTFLAERRWEDRDDDQDGAAAPALDPRCLHHARGWTSRPKQLQGGCPGCDEIAARERKARQDAVAQAQAEKERPADPRTLPTREQLAELRRSNGR